MNVIENRACTKVECKHCHSTLEVQENDIRVEHTDVGHIGAVFHVICGACQKDFTLKFYDVPITWQDRLLKTS